MTLAISSVAHVRLPANQLITFSQDVQSGLDGTAVQQNAVRYIINASTAQSIFGTPFGARRNLSQDALTNIANLAMFKNFKLNERASLEFNATLQNVFNHPNFQSIDPNIEDAGLTRSQQAPFVGFADPSVTNDVVGQCSGQPYCSFRTYLQVLTSWQVASLPAGFVRRVFCFIDICSIRSSTVAHRLLPEAGLSFA